MNKDVLIAHNLAVRWRQSHPRVGIDPDLCVVDPAPPEAEQLSSLRLWQPGHRCPAIAIEVVSENHPYKDYGSIQDKYADLGVAELWVIDPAAFDAPTAGQRVAIQHWQTTGEAFERTYTGAGPVQSAYLGAWLKVTSGRLLLSDDAEGTSRWLTSDEAKDAALEQKDAALAQTEAELIRLRQKLERLGGRD